MAKSLITSAHPRATTPGFDRALSFRIDQLITDLEAEPRPLRRALLCLQKRWAERRVPAFVPSTKGGA